MRNLAITLLLTIFFVGACQAKDSLKFPTISTQELASGIQDRSLHVIDNNSPATYQKGHIPTAVYMDYRDAKTGVLPQDKNAPLVFYCKNTRCTASEKGAKAAWDQGYRNVRVYKLGIDGWKEAGMEVETGGG